MDTLARAVPVEEFVGELMIGLAAARMLLGAGHIAGGSVIVPATSVFERNSTALRRESMNQAKGAKHAQRIGEGRRRTS